MTVYWVGQKWIWIYWKLFELENELGVGIGVRRRGAVFFVLYAAGGN
jgi:hypothetical protein